jgi:hypothetical protein
MNLQLFHDNICYIRYDFISPVMSSDQIVCCQKCLLQNLNGKVWLNEISHNFLSELNAQKLDCLPRNAHLNF